MGPQEKHKHLLEHHTRTSTQTTTTAGQHQHQTPQKHWQKRTTVPHKHLQVCNKRQPNTSCLETGKHYTDPQAKQRHQHWDVIQADIPSIGNRKDTREGDSSLHHTEHTKHPNTTRVQNQTLHKHSTTQHQQHSSNRF